MSLKKTFQRMVENYRRSSIRAEIREMREFAEDIHTYESLAHGGLFDGVKRLLKKTANRPDLRRETISMLEKTMENVARTSPSWAEMIAKELVAATKNNYADTGRAMRLADDTTVWAKRAKARRRALLKKDYNSF
jgi:hypothetical protein